MKIDTKYTIGDEVFLLHKNKIYKALIEGVTKTTLSEVLIKSNHVSEQETYHLKIKGGRLYTTNNVGQLYKTKLDLLEDIKIIESFE